jgi:membrane protein DedA with SNARE-associated domain
MRWRRFAAWNAVGSVAWATTVGGAAFALGTAGTRWLAAGGLALTGVALLRLWRSRGARARGRIASR